MSQNFWRKILNIAFLALVFTLTLLSIFRGEDISQIFNHIRTAEPIYIALSIACVILFIFGEAAVIHYMLKTLGVRIRFRQCCLFSFIGFFYSCITPSASGGQPMQVVAMRKTQIPVAVSTVVLAIVTVTYKLVLVLIGAAILIVRPDSLIFYLEPVESIIYLGMMLNVVCITLILLIVFDPMAVRTLATNTLALVNRIRPLRRPEKQAARIERIVTQYQGAAEYYRTHTHVIAHVFLITLAQRCVLFLITWFTYRSFNLSGHTMPAIVSLQAMISVASDMLPLPGGMGVSENLFLEIFNPIFGEELVLPGMMISRGISYYTQLLISGIMTVVAALALKEKK